KVLGGRALCYHLSNRQRQTHIPGVFPFVGSGGGKRIPLFDFLCAGDRQTAPCLSNRASNAREARQVLASRGEGVFPVSVRFLSQVPELSRGIGVSLLPGDFAERRIES